MIYFLSDAHLGSRAIENPEAHQRRVVDLLLRMGQDATAIYLLGDIFDFWYEYVWGQPKGYDLVLDTLHTLTQRGIEVHFFIGNHDIWTFGWLAKRTGMKVHYEPLLTEMCGKRVFLAHGDGLVPDNYMEQLTPVAQKRIRRFKTIRAIFHNRFLQHLFRLLPPALGNAFGYEWARRSRLKELAHPCDYKGENKEELVLYAKQSKAQADYYIFGHRHIELDLALASGARVVILGDMFRLFTYAEMNEKGELRLCNWEEE